MLRTVSIAAGCASILATGLARAQTLSGTYTVASPGGAVTLVLQQGSQGQVTGTLSGNGNTFSIQGSARGVTFVAVGRGQTGSIYLEGQLDKGGVRVAMAEVGPGNQPRPETARLLVFARAGGAGEETPSPAPAPGTAPAAPRGGNPAAPGAPPAMSPRDTQLTQLLLSSRWCSFSYSGVAGSSSGSSRTERVTFSRDGAVLVQTGGESYYSADVRNSLGNVIARGSTAGQSASGEQLRWRVSQGSLLLSGDGVTWQAVPLLITQNSNGYPIITADGKEYSQCN